MLNTLRLFGYGLTIFAIFLLTWIVGTFVTSAMLFVGSFSLIYFFIKDSDTWVMVFWCICALGGFVLSMHVTEVIVKEFLRESIEPILHQYRLDRKRYKQTEDKSGNEFKGKL